MNELIDALNMVERLKQKDFLSDFNTELSGMWQHIYDMIDEQN